ncbi:MAG: ABC transporter ATP-binding protein [Gammaproteobacteria bacterium]|nr:ABC transporter ATP-binding protein [Gammaproteobacteria bacterium]NIR98040.1 ABC transporter ATP-binding protein [Gammaproteobacteria bacterium]NIT63747.1 ABC transporter ATP-binding protein [Gammaproteobacteria bacterium]NIV19922.1 ATP-binding cassette domain-containing protein [Gammaproteobacteria bacterium]NIX11411.1 ATP-binding cassette domain-containing protein [Gammaproteobacteria bacterium]
MGPLLQVKKIECHYRGHTAVRDLTFHVNTGELACLLGPSGCGKTTVLRAIAGFEPLIDGEIHLRGHVVSRPGRTLAPERRHIGMVFQDYALFPHLDVQANVGFGLRRLTPRARRKLATRMLELVGLAGCAQRYPHELSGGQQQRVALARALAPRPDLILMDEPFSNLDIELRERLSAEVRDILKDQGTTGVMVTHDQHEAFALGDQIGVMREGRILQWDTAYNLYHEPADRFVADFIGQGRFLRGTLLTPDTLETEVGIIRGNRAFLWPAGTAVDVLLRPDDVIPDPGGELSARVMQRAFKGAEILYTLQLPTGSRLLSLFPSHHDHAIGDEVGIRIAPDHLVAFPREG